MKPARLLGVVGLVIVPNAAAADPIILSMGRGVNTVASASFSGPSTLHADSNRDALTVSSTATAPGTTAEARASLVSTLDPLHLAGTGTMASSVGTASDAYASANAYYDVILQLDQAYDFTFVGTFSGTGTTPYDATQPNTTTTWKTELRAATGYTFFYYTGDRDEDLTYDARMGPGNWVFYVTGQGDAASRVPGAIAAASSYSFRLDLTPATGPLPQPSPEPASLLLLGSGIAGVIARRRPARRE